MALALGSLAWAVVLGLAALLAVVIGGGFGLRRLGKRKG
jgi:hypothetical protein